MPVKTGQIASNDYNVCRDAVYNMNIGDTHILYIDDYKRCQKYIYEIGLKCKPRKEFSTKKLEQTELRVTRVI